ncbi:hypothetical protein DV738_g2585, partial [Chaetothyriales sp. CBS 135597]
MADLERRPLLEQRNDSTLKPEHTIDNDVLPEMSTLGRNIGPAGAYILVISRVIGSGIFAMPGAVVQGVGSPGLALLLWIVGALVAWAGLVIDMEYGCMLPRSGGSKVYLEYTYRHPRFLASTLVAIHSVLMGFTAANCIVFAKYIVYAFDMEPTEKSTKLLAIALLTTLTVIHGCFYKTGIWIQNALGWMKMVLIIFTILSGLFVVLWRPSTAAGLHTWNHLWDDSHWEWNTLSVAFFKCLYSYAGLGNINNVLNEVKNPIRTVKYVGPVALLTACLMYMLINVAYLSVVPLEEIHKSRELIAALFFRRLGFGQSFLPIAIALSAAGNVMVVMFSSARIKQEIARSGFLPWANLLASNKPFNAPLGALLIHYIPSFLVIVLPPAATVYSFIAEVEGYAGEWFAVAIGAGILILRYKKPDLPRPFRAWLPAVAFRLLLCTCLILSPLFPPKHKSGNIFYATYALVGIGVLLVAIAYWYIWTIFIPRIRGYRLEEETDTLSDGTTIRSNINNINSIIVVIVIMASTQVQQAGGHATSFEPITAQAPQSGISKHDVKTSLNYYKVPADGSPPAPTYAGKPEVPERPVEPLDVVVHDIRGETDKYTLDGNGFQIYSHESKEKDFLDDDKIKAEYYPETEQLLKDATGASRIFIFDHTIRRAPPPAERASNENTPEAAAAAAAAGLRSPVQRVHIDQSYSAGRSRVPYHLPDEADRLLKTRHQIINVWRPIKTILKDPLGVADAHSVPDSDLIPVPLIYPNRRGETLAVRPNEAHRWYFLYRQTPSEVTLIKCYDSKLDGRARRVPHTAFVNPATVNEAPRESIEVRALVFHEDEPAE